MERVARVLGLEALTLPLSHASMGEGTGQSVEKLTMELRLAAG